jgi:hypothetical protein
MKWRKSSYSAQANGCVEIAGTLDTIRDSKNPTGPTLRGVDVAALVTAVRAGKLGRVG